MKIILDQTKCISCGTCWALCDKYFEQGQEGKSHLKGAKAQDQEEIEIEEIDCAQNASQACPVQCITTL